MAVTHAIPEMNAAKEMLFVCAIQPIKRLPNGATPCNAHRNVLNTLPRMWSGVLIWTRVFIKASCVTIAQPIMTIIVMTIENEVVAETTISAREKII